MKVIMATIILAGAMFASSLVPAYWTGASHQFTTGYGNLAISCEYRAPNGQTFWKTFQGTQCSRTVEMY